MDSPDPDTVGIGLQLAKSHFHPQASASVQKAGITALASHASGRFPELMSVLLEVLLTLPPAERLVLLGLDDFPPAIGSIEPGAAAPAASGPPLTPIISQINALSLARALRDECG